MSSSHRRTIKPAPDAKTKFFSRLREIYFDANPSGELSNLPHEARDYFASGNGHTYVDPSKEIEELAMPRYDGLINLIDALKLLQDNNRMHENNILYLLGIHDTRKTNVAEAVLKRSHDDTVEWLEFIPPYILERSRGLDDAIEDIKEGAKLFEYMMLSPRPFAEFSTPIDEQNQADMDGRTLSRYFRYALWANAIQIYSVNINETKAKEVKKKYGDYNIRSVVVGRLPTCPDIPPIAAKQTYIDVPVVITEIVAQLAAKIILHSDDRKPECGIGIGYTLERLAFHMVTNKRNPIHWYPLVSFASEEISDNLLLDPRTSNGLSFLMRSIYLESQAHYLPFISHEHRRFINETLPRDLEGLKKERILYARKYLKNIRKLSRIILTVTGRENQGTGRELCASDGENYSFSAISNAYDELLSEMQNGPERDRIVGAILGRFIDENGGDVDQLEKGKFKHIGKRDIFGIQLRQLRQRAESDCAVWCVAGGNDKRRAVRAAILGKYVNRLVITEDIADYLIDTPLPKKR